jgi:hypothetical protein
MGVHSIDATGRAMLDTISETSKDGWQWLQAILFVEASRVREARRIVRIEKRSPRRSEEEMKWG